jgi:hypothetical protein
LPNEDQIADTPASRKGGAPTYRVCRKREELVSAMKGTPKSLVLGTMAPTSAEFNPIIPSESLGLN